MLEIEPGRKLDEDLIKRFLEFAILAPSTHNTQPWLFRISNNTCTILINEKFRLPFADATGRDLYESLGCCAENLVLISDYYGFFENIFFKGDHVEIVFKNDRGSIQGGQKDLAEFIEKRVNARGMFRDEEISGELLKKFENQNDFPSLDLKLLTDKSQIRQIAQLTAEGMRAAHANTGFRKEMSKWINNNLSSKKRGMPGYSMKMPFLLSFFLPYLIKKFNFGPVLAKLNYKSVSSASLVCVVSGDDTAENWFKVGRLAERMMLGANSLGYNSSIYLASVEIGGLYKKLMEITGCPSRPQFVLCVGKIPGKHRHSPRAPISEFLL